MLSPPTVYEQPDRDPGRQLFKSGYFTIRGECDLRPAFNAQIWPYGRVFLFGCTAAIDASYCSFVPPGKKWIIA
jgi:hypothetical protein